MSTPPTFPVFVAYVDQTGCGHQHAMVKQAINCARGLAQLPENKNRPLANYSVRQYNQRGEWKIVVDNPVPAG